MLFLCMWTRAPGLLGAQQQWDRLRLVSVPPSKLCCRAAASCCQRLLRRSGQLGRTPRYEVCRQWTPGSAGSSEPSLLRSALLSHVCIDRCSAGSFTCSRRNHSSLPFRQKLCVAFTHAETRCCTSACPQFNQTGFPCSVLSPALFC